jgi:hypothetical protein
MLHKLKIKSNYNKKQWRNLLDMAEKGGAQRATVKGGSRNPKHGKG